MRGFKTKLLLVCALALFVGAPVALGDWYPGDGHKMHYPQEIDPCGFDVGWEVQLWALGDDWQCSETGTVDDIHFWVSWKGGVGDPCNIQSFNIEIWSDYPGDPCGDPCDPCNLPWSHPEELLWGPRVYTTGTFSHRFIETPWQDWLSPSWELYDDHQGCWQINITDIANPFVQQQDEIYWLVISDVHTDPCTYVGWKESGSEQFNDPLVYSWMGAPFYWKNLNSPSPMDFAFVITGGPEPEPVIKWEQLPDPCNCGLDAFDYNMGFGYERIILADDWLCEGGVVTDLHWWGTIEEIGAGLMGFHLSIHDNGDPCCLPLDPALWEADIPIGSITVTPTGVFNNCGLEIIKYEYFLPAEDHFDQEEGDTYWFNLSALSSDPCNMCVWSWQEAGRSTAPILCPAADKYIAGLPPWPWQSIVWPYDPDEYSDMAFEITSEPNLPPDPIEAGIDWLVSQQDPCGFWQDPCDNRGGTTGLALVKLQERAFELGYDSPFDPAYPYKQAVEDGLAYLFSIANTIAINNQPAGDPDTNGNGIGVYFASDGHHRTYETGIVMMAIVAGKSPQRIVNSPGSPVNGWTYKQVVQDMVDYLAFGQNDAGSKRGGWGYSDNEDWSDNSNSGYAVLGLAYAESNAYGFNCTIPPFAKTELNIWINYIQNDVDGDPWDGGSGYMDPNDWVNILKTGSLIFQMTFYGDGTGVQRVQDALDYLGRTWNDPCQDPGWGNPAFGGTPHYQAMYCVMKGLGYSGIDTVPVNIDWYAEFANAIVNTQLADGSWPQDYWGGKVLATTWALLTLEKSAPPTPPHKPPVEHLKWSQPPIEYDPNDPDPRYCGWDEPSIPTYGVSDPCGPWFACWANPRQCHGDADGMFQGGGPMGIWYVGDPDLAILAEAFGHSYPDPCYNPCADFNRNLDVDPGDVFILATWWLVKEPPQGPGVPADCPTSLEEVQQVQYQIAADDFRCFGSMPIDSIHWWGSHLGWEGDEPPDATGIDPPVVSWRIGFWSNVPAEPMGDPCWSRPEMLLWQVDVPADRVQVERAGIDEHPINEGFPETCFQYYVDLEPDEVFWQEDFLADTADDVFWLSIVAMYPEPPDPCQISDPCHPWGWKTRPWSWMDDGVIFEFYGDIQPGLIINPWDTYMYPLEWYESYDLAFELDTDPNWIKWDQPFTGIRDWPHYEDVPSWAEVWDEVPFHMVVAADDWECTSPLPVTALAWYGSYLGYEYQPCDPCFVQPRPEQPAYFDITIWTDVPADPCDQIMPWSHPDVPVWQYRAYDYDEVLVGYDKHPHDPCGLPMPGSHEPVFRYTARIPEEEWFWQDENEAVYWLSIVAVYEHHSPEYEWGWTNHQHVYNDDAVQANFDPPKQQGHWNEILDQTGASADLSFTIYTDPYAELMEIDFGDAPDDPCAPIYPTLLVNDGARHIIGGPWLGDPCDIPPDAEIDGQPDPCALGDDNNVSDDEDGVVIPPLVQTLTNTIDIEVWGGVAGGGNVDFWIDWDADGDWTDPCDLVYSGWMANGTNPVVVTPPMSSVVGQTFSRCRISSQGGLSPTGLAEDGEIEDHIVNIEPVPLDFGDAPDPCYPTLLANDGARHVIVGPWFGDPCIAGDDMPDPEPDGQIFIIPIPPALGDDVMDGNDDEDGVIFPILTIGLPTAVTVNVSGGGGTVEIWIDYNGDGAWQAGELVFGAHLGTGKHTVWVTAPVGFIGTTVARCRISTQGAGSPVGLASDGEVEDHAVTIEALLDFGDAPAPYPTGGLGGARHIMDGVTFLGAGVDPEATGQPDPCALGDDNDGNDDEDGVVFTSRLMPGLPATVDVTASVAGFLNAWVDFNADGDWADPCEQVFTNQLLTGGGLVDSLTFQVPLLAKDGGTFARFRFNTVGGLDYFGPGPSGPFPDGEVEDHMVRVDRYFKWSQPPVEIDEGVYYGWDEPSIYGMPGGGLWFTCWENPRQCHGDADGMQELGVYWVFILDQAILDAANPSTYPDPPYDACADFNRDGAVDPCDVAIFLPWFGNPSVPADCPTSPSTVGFPIVADDWLCKDQRPVGDIHWWGSYYGWEMPEQPQPAPIGFHIGIWTDVPVDDPCNIYPYSHPGRMIWEYNANMAEVNEEPVGMDFHEQHPPDVCFKYDLQIPQEQWFWQEGGETVYWLTISAVYEAGVEPESIVFPWGWKTREHFYNDDAIKISMPTDLNVGVEFIEGEPIWPGWDMAFELTTQECVAPTNPDYTDWTTLAGYPACWCYCKHCNGDAEGCSQFAGQVPVYLLDLDIFLPAFGDPSVKTTPGHPGWCGDFARDAAFAGQVRVYTTDLARFLPNFGAPQANVAVSSGPGCSGPHVPPFTPNPPGCDTNPLPNTEYNFWTYPASCGANVVTPCQ
jgi:hypothetical protein